MENGFSSPRSESFPAGLRVLVVDDDPTWLKILEKMLKKCAYDGTACLCYFFFFFLSCLEKIFYAFEFAFVVLLIFMVSFANSCCLRGGFLKLCVSSSIMASGYVLFYVFFMGLILSNRIACKVHHFMFYM